MPSHLNVLALSRKASTQCKNHLQYTQSFQKNIKSKVKNGKTKIKHRAVAGISLGAFGAFTLVITPLAISLNGSGAEFFGISTVFILATVLVFPLSTIISKKAVDEGASAFAVSAIIMLTIFSVTALLNLFVNPGVEMYKNIKINTLLATAYTGIVTVFIARALNVLNYKYLGSAALSSLYYLENFGALMFATIMLNEKLAPYMIVGGALILLGVYFTESHHKSHSHKTHFHLFRHH